MYEVYKAGQVTAMAKELFKEERAKKRLDGWFLAREIVCNHAEELQDYSREMRAAKELQAILRELPLSISEHAIFAGSQSDAFARSYALINPTFQVETFSGYCDPTAVFGDLEPNAPVVFRLTRTEHRYRFIDCHADGIEIAAELLRTPLGEHFGRFAVFLACVRTRAWYD